MALVIIEAAAVLGPIAAHWASWGLGGTGANPESTGWLQGEF